MRATKQDLEAIKAVVPAHDVIVSLYRARESFVRELRLRPIVATNKLHYDGCLEIRITSPPPRVREPAGLFYFEISPMKVEHSDVRKLHSSKVVAASRPNVRLIARPEPGRPPPLGQPLRLRPRAPYVFDRPEERTLKT
ncbi:MAG TPA: hypothetical protein VFB34_02900 [Chloroflexota bacterium]|nr:hypothetical protein [Chloroflexota bacterium]